MTRAPLAGTAPCRCPPPNSSPHPRPPVWSNQLTDGGRLIVLLRMRGLTRSIVFEREDGNLANRAYELCDFVPMQDAGECRSDWSSSR
jgi:protein-L-isoaspartate O-methyltransferase